MIQLMTSSRHWNPVYYFLLLPPELKRKWKGLTAFLPKVAFMNTKAYRKQVFGIFWENVIKFIRNENKRRYILMSGWECLLQIASTLFSFIDKEDSNSSQSWARLDNAAAATGRWQINSPAEAGCLQQFDGRKRGLWQYVELPGEVLCVKKLQKYCQRGNLIVRAPRVLGQVLPGSSCFVPTRGSRDTVPA